MERHLVLGGSGFLGRHVACRLMEAGHQVTVVDVVPFPDPPKGGAAPHVQVLNLFESDDAELDGIVAKADVMHLYAWSSVPRTAEKDPLRDLNENVGLTIRLLEAMRRRGGGRLLFASSGGTVYGRLRTIPAPESHPLQPISHYGVSKVAAERYLGCYRALHGIDARIARLSNPFGAGQNPLNPQGAATAFAHRALAGQPISVWGDGSVVRDFIHVQDAVDGLIAAATAGLGHALDMPVFNVASGAGVNLTEIIEIIERHLGHMLAVEYLPASRIDVPVSVLSVAHAKDLLGWAPQMSFAEGMALMLKDLRGDPGRQFSSFN